MPLTGGQQAALSRLLTYYDGDLPYDPVNNPGGLRRGGNVFNFEPILKDIASVAQGTGTVGGEVATALANALAIYGSVQALSDAVTAAGTARGQAEGFAGSASGSATASFNAAALSQQWATLLGAEVAPGQGFSARYHANSAAGSAAVSDTRATASANSATSAANVAPNRTYAALIADLSPADGTVRQVATDPNAGVYLKVGASGAGSWSYIGPSIPGLDGRLKVSELYRNGLDHPTIAIPGYGDLLTVEVDSSDRPVSFSTVAGRYRLNASGAFQREVDFSSDVDANSLVFAPGTPIPVEMPPIGIFGVGDCAEIDLDVSGRPWRATTTTGDVWSVTATGAWVKRPSIDYDLGRQATASASVDSGWGGSLIATDIAVATGATNYAGDFYRGALWLRNPVRNSDGMVTAEVCWDRRGTAWEPIKLDAGGVVLTADIASRIVVIMPSYGQSLSIGGNNVGTAVLTSAAVDPGFALMPNPASGTPHPYIGRRGISGLTDLRHAAIVGSSGETHLSGLYRTFSAKCTAQGAKLKTVQVTAGQGGHSLFMLGPTWNNWSVKSRGGGWQDLIRNVKTMVQLVEAQGLIPVMAPLTFIHGEEDSGAVPGMSASEYVAGMRELLSRYNAAIRRELGWHAQAPSVGMILGQCVALGPRMAANPRKFGRGFDGPRLAQWALSRLHDGFLPVRPSHDYTDADGIHVQSAMYYLYGERLGRQVFEYTFGRYSIPVEPIGITRVDSTSFDLVFSLPAGASLVFDTATVADALDGMKGFVLWNAATGSAVAITGVALKAGTSDTVTITHTAVSGAEYWLDYALWNDPGGPNRRAIGRPGENSGLAGVRGNLRADTAYASTITDYGGAAWTDYDWAPGFRTFVTASVGLSQTVSGQI